MKKMKKLLFAAIMMIGFAGIASAQTATGTKPVKTTATTTKVKPAKEVLRPFAAPIIAPRVDNKPIINNTIPVIFILQNLF